MTKQVAIKTQEIQTLRKTQVFAVQQKGWNTLLLILKGSAKVDTGTHIHNLMLRRLIFIPEGYPSTISLSENSLVYLFSIDKEFNNFPKEVVVNNCSLLAQEILIHFHKKESPMDFSQRTRDLYHLIFTEKGVKDPFHLSIPMPVDPRGRKCYDILVNGHLSTSHDVVAKKSGASKRTLERIFQNDLGMTFSKWRQRVRIQQSILLLHRGYSIAEVTNEVGYSSASSFIHSFREILDISPGKYIKQNLNKVVEDSE